MRRAILITLGVLLAPAMFAVAVLEALWIGGWV